VASLAYFVDLPSSYNTAMSHQSRQLHPDAQALRDYITAGDQARYDLLPQGVVMVGVTHSNLTMSMPDIRLDLHMTVSWENNNKKMMMKALMYKYMVWRFIWGGSE